MFLYCKKENDNWRNEVYGKILEINEKVKERDDGEK